MIDILYADEDIVVCIKPPRVLSTDEPGGLPELLRQTLGTQDFRTVHRLDRVVSGLMVVARNAAAASELSRQIREDQFEKEYQAVVHSCPEREEDRLTDLLMRDKARKMTMVAQQPSKETREAVLHYQVLGRNENMTLVKILLETGRTHQIRVQFSSRGYPLVGERKYAQLEDACGIALWSHSISFYHPRTGDALTFTQNPGQGYPWELFSL
jgi:23S rRNA pseudouridine1911/1915/1917 synthase